MIDTKTRKQILAKGKPEPKNVPWWGELNFGAYYTEEEIEAAEKAIRDSMHWSVGFGCPFPKEVVDFEDAFAEYCGAKYAVAVTNCGVALDLAIRCLDLKEGDEVIVPAINYKASQMAILDHGGKIVFCDIDPKTLNLDLSDVLKRITKRTKAILPVYQTGLAAPILELLEIAKACNLKIIGDAARAIGAKFNGHRVGSKEWITCFSFHSQKLMTTLGEGGMVTTNDKAVADRIRDMCSYGGEYGWGLNYRMNKVQAAVGMVQLARLDEMLEKRRAWAERRNFILKDVPEIILPYEPEGYYHTYYVYPILVKSEWAGTKRDKIMSIMEKFGIVCSITNKPVYQRWQYIAEKCGTPNLPVSEDAGERLFCPPIHPLFTLEQELYVDACILEAIDIVRNE